MIYCQQRLVISNDYCQLQQTMVISGNCIIVSSADAKRPHYGAADNIRVLADASRRTTTRINRTAPTQNYVLSGLAGYPPPR